MYKKDLKSVHYIIKDGKVLGRVTNAESAYRVAFIREAAFCCIYEHLLQIDDEWLYELYQKYVGKLPPPPMVVETMARETFHAIEVSEIMAIRKPSVADVLRAMYQFKRQYTRGEIEKMIPGVKWNSVRVIMSKLRREGVDIRHHGDGWYVRR